MKLFTGVLFIVCVLFGAGIFTIYLTNTDFLGYAGYCSYVPIKWGFLVYLLETWLFTFFLLFLISYRNFQVAYALTLSRLILGVFSLNLGFIAYKIFEFPRVLEQVHWGFYPNPQTVNDQVVGLDYNPLLPIFILFALSMLWLNHVSKGGISKIFYRVINFIIVGLIVTVAIVVALSISYDMCMG